MCRREACLPSLCIGETPCSEAADRASRSVVYGIVEFDAERLGTDGPGSAGVELMKGERYWMCSPGDDAPGTQTAGSEPRLRAESHRPGGVGVAI